MNDVVRNERKLIFFFAIHSHLTKFKACKKVAVLSANWITCSVEIGKKKTYSYNVNKDERCCKKQAKNRYARSEREAECLMCVFIPQSNIFMNVTNSPDYVCAVPLKRTPDNKYRCYIVIMRIMYMQMRLDRSSESTALAWANIMKFIDTYMINSSRRNNSWHTHAHSCTGKGQKVTIKNRPFCTANIFLRVHFFGLSILVSLFFEFAWLGTQSQSPNMLIC